MLEFLNDLRESNKDDEKVLKAINEIESELNNKKYGLVWEEHEEEADRMLKSNIPVFSEVHNKEIKEVEDDGFNFLLEGDNLHSLKLLEKTHKGKVDVIYIDPPYNTGNEDFAYNDAFVGTDDSYRHSKWLSFMNKRLKIARELLSDDGVIFISIDDNEYAALKTLCDEIFGENNRLSTHHIQVRYANKNLNEKKDFQECLEYVLVYSKKNNTFEANKPYEEYSLDKFIYEVKESNDYEEELIGNKRVKIFKKGSYELIKHEKGKMGLLKGTWASGSVVKGNASGKYFETYLKPRKKIDGLSTLYKVEGIGEDGLGYRYFTGPQKENATQGLFYSGVPLKRVKEIEEGGSRKYKPIQNFYDFSPDFGNIRHEGSMPFNSGKKPVKMLKQFLNYHKGKNISVLDFFAGSGSTAEAVLELNKEDGGNRKFILCTNNENNICEDITYQRIKTVITGKRKDGSEYSEGIPANLKYYRTDFVSKDEEYLTDDLNEHIEEMVQLELGVDIDDSNYCLVLSDDDADELEEKIDEMEDLKGIYVSKDVLLTSSQKTKFKDLEKYVIPDCYYDLELKENGE